MSEFTDKYGTDDEFNHAIDLWIEIGKYIRPYNFMIAWWETSINKNMKMVEILEIMENKLKELKNKK